MFGLSASTPQRPSTLVANDTNNSTDVFVYDRRTTTTERVSVNSSGSQANNGSAFPTTSADGRFIAFHSTASKLVANDTNGTGDVFVRLSIGAGVARHFKLFSVVGSA